MAESPAEFPAISKPKATQARKVTPPEQVITFPLSPPPSDGKNPPLHPLENPPPNPHENANIEKALALFKSHQQNDVKDPKSVDLLLSPSAYEKLLDRLDADISLRTYVESRIRYDYNAISATLSIHMGSPAEIHEKIIAFLVFYLLKQLEDIGKGSSKAARFARAIQSNNSANIRLKGDSKRAGRSPDGQFKHSAAIYPGVILEVSYSQSPKDIEELARMYIEGSQGHIRVIVGIDINYPIPSRASISIWQTRLTQKDDVLHIHINRTVEDQIIPDLDDYTADHDQDFFIPLDNFSNVELIDFRDEFIPNIVIKMADLAQFVALAKDATAEDRKRALEEFLSSENKIEISPAASKREAEKIRPQDEAKNWPSGGTG